MDASASPSNLTPRRALASLLAFRGRIGRLAFAGGFAALIVVVLGLIYLSVALAGNDQGMIGGGVSVAAIIAALLTLCPLAALLARRLHDLNRSGWHSLWLAALWLSPNLMPDALETIAALAAMATFLALVALPGTRGLNAYGDVRDVVNAT